MLHPRYKANRLICGFDRTPFVNVTVVLAALFVIGAMTVPPSHHGSGVDLSRVANPISMSRANREDAVQVAITRDGKFFFGSKPTRASDLPQRIRDSIARGSEWKVYIKADARAKYGWVAVVVDRSHEAGIEKIGFLVDQRKTLPVAVQ